MARWDLMTSDEIGRMIASGRDLAVIPVGATEQHGPHLAAGCDTISAATLAELACERADILVLPALAYGCSLGHTDRWPGTLSLHPTTLTKVIVELGRWAVATLGCRKTIRRKQPAESPTAPSSYGRFPHMGAFLIWMRGSNTSLAEVDL